MRIPPFLIGAATIFWGFSSGWEIFSIIAAVIFESSVVIRTRFELKERDFVRISDISSIVMLILLFYAYLENEPRQIFMAFLASSPIVFMPLLFAQLFSTSDKVVIGTGFGKTVHKHRPIDIRTLYVVAVVIGSASTVNKSIWFFPALFILVILFLSGSVLNRRSSIKFMIFTLVVFIGSLFLSEGIVVTHKAIKNKMMELYQNWYKSQNTDPFKTSTALGETGYLKLSGNIIMRVKPENREGIPIYIKSADYNILSGSVWHSRFKKTTAIGLDDDMAWQLFGEGEGPGKMFISTWMGRNGKGVLQLPIGAKRAVKLDVAGLEKTELGTITVDEGPELLSYGVYYDKDVRFEPSPAEKDLLVPKTEASVLEKIILDNVLKGENPAATVKNVEKYFSKFSYTLDLDSKGGESVLEDFLIRTKSGHCEYFATATTLLFRAMGIPARYSVGYSVSEYSMLEDQFVVRARDGHAWVTAWIDDKWITVDNTPPQWRSVDREKRSIFEPIKDFFSWLRIEYEMFRRQKSETFNRALIILATILTLFMLVKIYLRKKIVSGSKNTDERVVTYIPQGLNSPFYEVFDKCRVDLPKKDQESLRQWLERSRKRLFEAEKLSDILRLHEELRFNPEVDGVDVSKKLTELCGEWFRSLNKSREKS